MRFFDLHCDTPYECFKRNLGFDNPYTAVSFKEGAVFCEWQQCFAVWIKDDIINPFSFYKSVISDFKSKLKPCPDNLTPILTVEGGALIEDYPERIYELKGYGVSALTLTWNGKNSLASGVNFGGGLTSVGRKTIDIMNEVRIACDLSHINSKGFYEALELSDFSFVSHSCCSSVNKHIRNLDDDRLKALFQKGGIIGLCLYPVFLGEGDVFAAFYKHLYHLLDMGAEDYIAVGSDFDGADMDVRLQKISQIPDLYAYLEKKGIENTILDKVFFKNAEKFFLKL